MMHRRKTPLLDDAQAHLRYPHHSETEIETGTSGPRNGKNMKFIKPRLRSSNSWCGYAYREALHGFEAFQNSLVVPKIELSRVTSVIVRSVAENKHPITEPGSGVLIGKMEIAVYFSGDDYRTAPGSLSVASELCFDVAHKSDVLSELCA